MWVDVHKVKIVITVVEVINKLMVSYHDTSCKEKSWKLG
jgi:hypothetical protein